MKTTVKKDCISSIGDIKYQCSVKIDFYKDKVEESDSMLNAFMSRFAEKALVNTLRVEGRLSSEGTAYLDNHICFTTVHYKRIS